MKLNKAKYIILILIALFFASTNEVCAKEAEQNYNTESHSFIDTGNYTLNISYNNFKKDLTNTFHANPCVNYPGIYNSFFNFLPGHPLRDIPLSISNQRYLDNSILRI